MVSSPLGRAREEPSDHHRGEGPVQKRHKNAYLPGSIIRVEVKNFMTYSECVIEPGPTLNLVLGPNGTGKSSFVCALCVGLAGSTKLLGRADDVGSYIRRGKSRAQVEVTIAREGGGQIKVKREIKKDGEGKVSSEFSIDGQKRPARQVQELVKKYNIQLDNLCQFLPQDKVAEFARMKPTELLRATELAIGDGELLELHESLITEKKQLDERERQLEVHETAVGRNKEELKELEKVLGPIREKQRLKEEMDMLEALKLWKVHEGLSKELEVDEKTFKKAETTLDRLKKEQLSLKNGPVKKKSMAKEKTEKAAKAAAKEARASNLEAVVTDIENELTGADRKVEAINSLEERSKKQKSQVENAEHDIRNLNEQIRTLEAETTDVEKTRKEIRMVDVQLKDLQAEELSFSKLNHELDDMDMRLQRARKTLQAQLSRLGERQNQALAALERDTPGTEQAYNAIKASKPRFRGQVLGPLALEVEVHNGHYARVLERHLPKTWLWYYFVEYPEDMSLLRKMMEEMNVTPRIVIVEGDRNAPLKRLNGRSSSLAHFGVAASLDETFTCNPLIKQALDNHFYISSTFVMDEKGKNDWSGLLDAHPRIETIYTANQQIRNKQSKYDAGSRAQMTSTFRASQFLHMSTSKSSGVDEELAKVRRDLQQNQKEIEEVARRKMDIRPDTDRITLTRRALVEERNKLEQQVNHSANFLRKLKAKLKGKTAELEHLKKRPDPLSQKGDYVKAATVSLKSAMKKSAKLLSFSAAFSKHIMLELSNELAAKELSEHIKVLADASDKKRQEREEYEKLVKELEARVTEFRQKVGDARTAAVNVTGDPVPDDLQKEFDARATLTLDDVDDALASKKARHDTIRIVDKSAEARYKRLLEALESSEDKVAGDREARDVLRNKVEQLKATWLPEVRRLVKKIDQNFSEAFKTVGIGGEVVFNESSDDFAKYSIDLRVRFREEGQLITLDSAYHSGGESSTSTILYLMALQGVTVSPFRVVDEINQGMDSVNERQVFKLLCDAATAPDTPQCFLLTPKLLPDLPFSDDVTVLQIMNGVHIADVANGYDRRCLLGSRILPPTAAH